MECVLKARHRGLRSTVRSRQFLEKVQKHEMERSSQLNDSLVYDKKPFDRSSLAQILDSFLSQSVTPLTASQGFSRFVLTVLARSFPDLVRPLQSNPPSLCFSYPTH
jgi:hypothetical protein